MDSLKQPFAEAEKPALGIVRDLDRLKTHGSASAAELQEFLVQMRGRSPQEVLGLVAASQLTRSLVLAAIGAIVLVAGFTIVPYLLVGPAKPATAPQKAAPATSAEGKGTVAEDAPQAAAPSSPSGSAAAPSADPRDSQNPQVKPADAEKAVKSMGIDETKAADPKKNPMEDKLDNLLDKVE